MSAVLVIFQGIYIAESLAAVALMRDAHLFDLLVCSFADVDDVSHLSVSLLLGCLRIIAFTSCINPAKRYICALARLR
jgi:hypothetical protein